VGLGQFTYISVFDIHSLKRLSGPLESFVDCACGVIFCMRCQWRCMRCHWHRLHTVCIFHFFPYQSHFPYDFHFLKLFENFILNAESTTTHAPRILCQWPFIHCVSGVNDTSSLCMGCIRHRMHIENFEFLCEYEFKCKKLKNLIRGQGRMF
jgi:hypothetical protein